MGELIRQQQPWTPNEQEVRGQPEEFELAEDDPSSKGLDEAQINRFPRSNITIAQMDKSCSVCLEDFERGISIRTLPCRHFFHSQCIERWLKNHTKCPMCRTS